MDVVGSFRLDGRVAVVIGGSGVLCSRMAYGMATVGARVVVVGRDRVEGDTVAGQFRRDGLDVVAEACDASDRRSLKAFMARIQDSHGRVDILVSGAGANSDTAFLDISDGERERMVAVNQLAVIRAGQMFGRYFVERATSSGEGARLNVITVGSMRPRARLLSGGAEPARPRPGAGRGDPGPYPGQAVRRARQSRRRHVAAGQRCRPVREPDLLESWSW